MAGDWRGHQNGNMSAHVQMNSHQLSDPVDPNQGTGNVETTGTPTRAIIAVLGLAALRLIVTLFHLFTFER